MNLKSIDLDGDEFITSYYYYKTNRSTIRNICIACIVMIRMYLPHQISSIYPKILDDIIYVQDGLFGDKFSKYAKNGHLLTRLFVFDKYGKKHSVKVNLLGHEYHRQAVYWIYKGDPAVYLTMEFNKISELWNLIKSQCYYKTIGMVLNLIIYDTNHTEICKISENLKIRKNSENWCYLSCDLYKYIEKGCILHMKLNELEVFDPWQQNKMVAKKT